ncbi:DUF1648 domain-containing protein [Cohnella endophytica]|uniref:DUF1648 domain-containing protein n=1 Tax=Cohnella endophytica TaxID=2419778 RepID=A0A494XI36_9BACL|nr:SdpI family protein [Cohnella endophytica]RKP47213.1 DUF1648 domain-containing protein [Cohnella endophytica]
MTTNSNTPAKTSWLNHSWILIAINVLIFIVMFLVFNDKLPDNVASHYNVHGEVDRTMAKWSFWLLYAGLGIALPVLISLSRYIDPRQSNYARFEGYFYLIRWVISLFLQAVFLFIILDNAGYDLPMPKLIVGGLGVLWMLVGNRMGQVRSNFFIGIRTPWALMDDDNWRHTHRLGAKLWVASGLLMFVTAWFGSMPWRIGVTIAGAAASSLIPTAYSYLLFKNKRNA